MKLILISGKKRTGKTTLQKALFKKLFNTENAFPLEINFADEIYRIHDYAVKKMKELGLHSGLEKHRELLQFLGTEWGRNFYGENVWCEVLKKKVEVATRNGYTHIIVSDCRFRNEFDSFPEALRIRLVADIDTRKNRSVEGWNDLAENHPSETDLDQYGADKKFDLTFCTDLLTVEDCVWKIMTQLQID